MIRRLVATVFASSLLLAACGDDSGGGSGDRDAIIELLEGEGETPKSAACFADELSEFSLADIEVFLDGDVSPDVEASVEGESRVAEIETVVFEAAEKCSEAAGEDEPETTAVD